MFLHLKGREYSDLQTLLDRHATLVRAGQFVSAELVDALKDYMRRVTDYHMMARERAYEGNEKERCLDLELIVGAHGRARELLTLAEGRGFMHMMPVEDGESCGL